MLYLLFRQAIIKEPVACGPKALLKGKGPLRAPVFFWCTMGSSWKSNKWARHKETWADNKIQLSCRAGIIKQRIEIQHNSNKFHNYIT